MTRPLHRARMISRRADVVSRAFALLGVLAGSAAAQSPVASRRHVESPLPIAVTNNAVAALTRGPGAGLYSFLGVDSSKRWSGITRRAFFRSAGTKAWQELPPVPGAVGRLAALAFGVRGQVYLIGGYTVDSAAAERSLANVDIWDPVRRVWSAGAPTPVAVDDAVGGVWRDSLIVLVTGWHDTDNVAEVQLYDPATNRWTRGTPFPGTPVFGGGGTVAGHQVLVFGGARRASGPVTYTMAAQAWLGTMDARDPAKITWDSLPPMPGPSRYRAGAIACGSRIVVAGGTDNPYNYNGIGYDGQPSAPIAGAVSLDLRTRRWSAEPAPLVPVMDLRAIVALRGQARMVGGMRAGQRVAADVVSWPLSRCGARPMPPFASPGDVAPPPANVARPLAASSLTWNQAQREAGFSVMDTLFPNRVIRRGPRVSPMPAGAPLAAFAPGGALAAMLEQYMAEQKTAGIIIVHDGQVRLERYAMGQTAARRWTSMSVAKSVTSTLVGAALRDGFITSLDDPVTRYITQMKGSAYDDVTIRQLLTMTSGVKWNEDYTDHKSDVARFYTDALDPGVDRTVSYMRKLPREAPAGTKWVYKTGETNLIGVLVMEATHKTLAEYASEKIWGPVGMEADASWMKDDLGHEYGGCCLQATLRDYARIGGFMLGGARVNGASILPDGWIEAATRTQTETGDPFRGYGYQWWTEAEGRYNAIGIHGQSIHVDPARKLVVAIHSAWPEATSRDRSAARRALWAAIAEAIDAAK